MSARARLRRRLRYLWAELPPEPVELLSAALSATFALVLGYRGDAANAIDHARLFAASCALSASLKVVGVLWEVRALRVAGLLLGSFFWIVLGVVFLLAIPGSVSWLCFLVLALAQFWALRRVVRP